MMKINIQKIEEKVSRKVRKIKEKISSVIKKIEGCALMIQILANITVLLTLAFAVYQYKDTREPIRQNKLLCKAEAYINLGEYKKAKKIYEKLSKQDISIAQTNLGYMYKTGFGGSKDYEKARMYYEKAISNGSRVALNNLIVLDFENWSEDSAQELLSIFKSAYEMNNTEVVACAIAYIYDENIDDILEIDILRGAYDDVFRKNNGEELEKEIIDEKHGYKKGGWEFIEDIYASSSSKAYEGIASKLVLVGAEASADNKGNKGILYHYQKFEWNKICTDNLQQGFVRLDSFNDNAEKQEFTHQ